MNRVQRGAGVWIEAVTYSLRSHLAVLLGMAALALGGLLFSSNEVRNAIEFAAIAAAAIDVVGSVDARVRSADDRALAAATVASAAGVLLDARIQLTDFSRSVVVRHPELSLRAIAKGASLDMGPYDGAEEVERVRLRLFDNRQLFFATMGTQLILLDGSARSVALEAMRQVDGAIITLDRLANAYRRDDVLRIRVPGEALAAYEAADLVPISALFHEFAGDAAAHLMWLEDPARRMPPRPRPTPSDTRRDDRSRAARALAADVAETVLQGGGRASNWLAYSNLSALKDPTLEDIAALGDLAFNGQAIGQGWRGFTDGLSEDARLVLEVADTIEKDLQADERNAMRVFAQRLEDARKASSDANDAERDTVNAPAKGLSADAIASAHEVFAARRRSFLHAVRDAVKASEVVRALRPATLPGPRGQ